MPTSLRRYCYLILVICLNASLISYDIAWAYPESFAQRKPRISTLAPELFSDKIDSPNKFFAKTLEYLIEFKNDIPREVLTLDAVKAVINKHMKEKWFTDHLSCESYKGEVLIAIDAGTTLRYFDPNLAAKSKSGYSEKASETMGRICKQLLVAAGSSTVSRVSKAVSRRSRRPTTREEALALEEAAENEWKEVKAKTVAFSDVKKVKALSKATQRYAGQLFKAEQFWQRQLDSNYSDILDLEPSIRDFLAIPASLPLELFDSISPKQMADMSAPSIVKLARRISALKSLHTGLGPDRSDNIAVLITNNVSDRYTTVVAVTRDRPALMGDVISGIVGKGLGADLEHDWSFTDDDGVIVMCFLVKNPQDGGLVREETIANFREELKLTYKPRYVVMPSKVARLIVDAESLSRMDAGSARASEIAGRLKEDITEAQEQLAHVKRPAISPETEIHLKARGSNDLPKVVIGKVHKHETPDFDVAAYGLVSDAGLESEQAVLKSVAQEMLRMPIQALSSQDHGYIHKVGSELSDDVANNKRKALVKLNELIDREKASQDKASLHRVQVLSAIQQKLESRHYRLQQDEIGPHKEYTESVFLKRISLLEKAKKDFPDMKDVFEVIAKGLTVTLAGTLRHIDVRKTRAEVFFIEDVIPQCEQVMKRRHIKQGAYAAEMYSLYIDILSELRFMGNGSNWAKLSLDKERDVVVVAKKFDIVSFLMLWSLYSEQKKDLPIAAIISEDGAPQSHWVMVATFLNIPVLTAAFNKDYGIESGYEVIADQREIVVDADAGSIVVNPSAQEMADAKKRRQELIDFDRFVRSRTGLLGGLGISLPADKAGKRHKIGIELQTFLNVDLIRTFEHYITQRLVVPYGDGVGLVRSEFEFTNDCDMLADLYGMLAKRFRYKPVIIRAIDYAPDKSENPHLPESSAVGIDYYREQYLKDGKRSVIITQLKGILLAFHKYRNIRVMFPMVREPTEVDFVIQLIDEAKKLVHKEHRSISISELDIPAGIMIETPRAVEMLPYLMDKVDFISYGTNDLIKAHYGVSRDSFASQPVYRSFKKYVALSIANGCALANHMNQQLPPAKRKEVCVCGDAARSPKYFFYLLYLQAKFPDLLIHPSAPNQYILRLKEMARWVTFEQLSAIYDMLDDATSDEQEALINQRLDELIASLLDAEGMIKTSDEYKKWLAAGDVKGADEAAELKLPTMHEMMKEADVEFMRQADPLKGAITFIDINPPGFHHRTAVAVEQYFKSIVLDGFMEPVMQGIHEEMRARLRGQGLGESEITSERIEAQLKRELKRQLGERIVYKEKDCFIDSYLRKNGLRGKELRLRLAEIMEDETKADPALRDILAQHFDGEAPETALKAYITDKLKVLLANEMRKTVEKAVEQEFGPELRKGLEARGLSGDEKAFKTELSALAEVKLKEAVAKEMESRPEWVGHRMEGILQEELDKYLREEVLSRIRKKLADERRSITLVLLKDGKDIFKTPLKLETKAMFVSEDLDNFGRMYEEENCRNIRIEVENWPNAEQVALDFMYVINTDKLTLPQDRRQSPRAPKQHTSDGMIRQGEISFGMMVQNLKKGKFADITDQRQLKSDLEKVRERIGGRGVEDLLGLEGPVRVIATNAVMAARHDFTFGFYSHAPPVREEIISILGSEEEFNRVFPQPTIVVSAELMNHPVPSIRQEYLYHEATCCDKGHYGAIFQQQNIFRENYGQGEYQEEGGRKYLAGHRGDPLKPFKGRLGEVLRRTVDMAHSSGARSIFSAAAHPRARVSTRFNLPVLRNGTASFLSKWNPYAVIKRAPIAMMSVAFSLVYWTTESLLFSYVFNREGIISNIFPADAYEVLTRSLTSAIIVSLGFVAQRFIDKYKKNEQRLEASKKRYADLFEESPVAFHNIDTYGIITKVNKQWLALLGYNDEREVVGRSIFDFIVPEQRESAKERFRLRLKGVPENELPQKGEGREYLRKDGSRIVAETRNSVITDEATGKQIGAQTSFIDITERRQAMEKIRTSEERYRQLFYNAPVGYHEVDMDGRISRVNRTELEMLGYTVNEVLGRPVWEFAVDKDVSRAAVQQKLATGTVSEQPFERVYARRDGSHIHVLIKESAIRDAGGKMIGIRTAIQDISDRKKLEEELKELSIRDPLTGVYSRRYLEDKDCFPSVFSGFTRMNSPISFLMLDIDYFKQFNDKYGHAVGDDTLREVAHAMLLEMRRKGTDIIIRYGGEEFLIVLIGADIKVAEKRAKKILEQIDSLATVKDLNGRTLSVTASIGFVECDYRWDKGTSPEDIIKAVTRKADAALYEAKDRRRKLDRSGKGEKEKRQGIAVVYEPYMIDKWKEKVDTPVPPPSEAQETEHDVADGFIRQGRRSFEIMVNALKKAADDPSQTLKSDEVPGQGQSVRTIETDAVIMDKDDFSFGFYSHASGVKEAIVSMLGSEEAFGRIFPQPTVVYARQMLKHNKDSILQEYAYHEAICHEKGHYEAIFQQQQLFPENYSEGDCEEADGKKYLKGYKGDPTKPFKGEMGAVLRSTIDSVVAWKARLAALRDASSPKAAGNGIPGAGSKLLISEELFSPEDVIALRSILNTDLIEIMPADAIRAAATNKEASKNNLGCIIGRDEFNNMWKDSHRINNRSTVLVLDEDLKDSRYLYLEGVMSLATAMMNGDTVKVRAYAELLFSTAVDDSVLELLKKDNPIEFAIRAILKFRPIAPIRTEELMENRKSMEASLAAA
ncbi:MAG: PAS domain S-box protein [Candidatus Omnitrophica bacterium]|nr:PAS domain S-box protein [Candidatus Omnitrophota bacterium]